MVEDDPNAKKKKKFKKSKAYSGSKTSQYDFPSHTSGLYDSGSSKSDYGLSSSASKPLAATSNISESKSYEPICTTKYEPEKKGNKKNKSRYRKYTGSKTSYGDIGGSSYTNPGVCGRSTDVGRFKSAYEIGRAHV